MSEIDELIKGIIRQKPDIDENKLQDLIKDKKKKVGSGYLTDSGAAYLVASDLNIYLEVVTSSEILIKDVYVGANEVSVIGRIFTVTPTKTFSKKDGTEGKYRRLTIFDKETFIVITLWDDQTNLVEDRNLTQDQLVKIKKGYVKAGLDGQPIIHLGKNGDLENVDNNKNKIPIIDEITREISSMSTPETNLALTGVIKSPPRISEFTKKDGTPGRVLHLYLTNVTGEKSIRAAIWNNSSLSGKDIPQNAVVKLIGLKTRFSKDGSIEIHGDDGTSLDILSIRKAFGESSSGRFRVLSIGQIRIKEDGESSVSLLVVNESNNFYTLILKDEVTEAITDIKTEILIDCEFKELSALSLLCNKKSQFKILNEDDESFSKLESLKYKINDIPESQSPLLLEVIALSRDTNQEILTKTGETVKKREVIVGDETKEIKIVAWRDLSNILDDITPGQRLKLIGVVSSKGLGGVPELLVKSYTQIEKMSQSSQKPRVET